MSVWIDPQFSKTYGSVFTVYFGPQKIVVLSGYKTVKEALVSRAEEFGDRAVTPIFQDLNNGHGKNTMSFFHFRLNS